MKVFNTMSGKKEEFLPLHGKKVGMYVCGPTVYDFGHLGHGRSAVSFDVIRRYLKYRGYDVTFVTNYTDIEDKMIHRAELMKITVPELAARIIPEYERDYGSLGVLPGDVQPKATDHVQQMIEIVSDLEKKGMAYVISDGVYYDVSRFKQYGKLSGQNLDELKNGIRVAVNEEKRTPHDFVLWKFSKPGEPSWESPWGPGRPGWHIECSAMSRKYLGDTFEIHGGGADLVFPHHECEIAQSEASSKKPFAKYWLHNGFIRIDNEKMSKSLGNFFTLRDIFEKYLPQAVRFLFLQTHYRSPIDFSDAILDQATNGLTRIHDFMRRLYAYDAPDGADDDAGKVIETCRSKFENGMDDDFETPVALAACFDLIKDANVLMDSFRLSDEGKNSLIHWVREIDMVLAIFESTSTESLDSDVLALISQREDARKRKDWKKADELREELLQHGVQVEDTAKGTVWKKV
ncbi:MAG TPA: cysteine--tRNA ligase [Candidatus Gracilibacteria bacterium]|nr:cysteine--tRNA ligase [Candidatus Gracilibacteria bacterium]